MDLVYGAATDSKLPMAAGWLANTHRTGPLGGTYVRSAQLQQIDAALTAFHVTPTLANLTQLSTRNQTWRTAKTSCFGNFSSRRAPQANALATSIQDYQAFLADRITLMQRVNAHINGVDLGGLSWKQLYLAAELYDFDEDPGGWAAVGQRNVEALEFEARAGSGWAMNAPATVPEWAQKGAAEVAAATNWPTPTLSVRMQLPRIGLTVDQWPPWTTGAGGAALLPFLRKGLFCHAAAALAAHWLDTNRLVLEAGLSCRIRTIDIIHQQAAEQGGMTHWWVCVNKPDRMNFGTWQHQFNTFNSFRHLPMCGGFVVDLWGPLWDDQGDDAPLKAVSNAATAIDCVADVPGDYLGDTATISRARFQYF